MQEFMAANPWIWHLKFKVRHCNSLHEKKKDETPKLSKPKPTNHNQFKYPGLHFLSLAVKETYKKSVPHDL